ncbi:MAG: hypothetical protein AMXMBFR13_46860 [Phycisphaerae bacterium]
MAQWPKLLAMIAASQLLAWLPAAYLVMELTTWDSSITAVALYRTFVTAAAIAGTSWAAWALWKGRDAGRVACIILLFGSILLAEITLVGAISEHTAARVLHRYQRHWADDVHEARLRILSIVAGEIVAPTLLMVFLATGLRKRSLSRPRANHFQPIPDSAYSIRRDWLLLILVLGGMLGLKTLGPVTWVLQLSYSRSESLLVGFWQTGEMSTVVSFFSALIIPGFLWWRPHFARFVMGVMVLVLLISLTDLLLPHEMPLGGAGIYWSRRISAMGTTVFPWLAMFLFVLGRDLCDDTAVRRRSPPCRAGSWRGLSNREETHRDA